MEGKLQLSADLIQTSFGAPDEKVNSVMTIQNDQWPNIEG